MIAAARWCFVGSIVVAVGVTLVVLQSRASDERPAPEPMIELGRCPDGASRAIAEINRDFDYCVARYFYEVTGVRERDGQLAIVAPYDTWFHVCANQSFCSKRSSPDARVETWTAWDMRYMFIAGSMACVAVYDGGARIHRGDNGAPDRIETEAGTEVDRCLALDAHGPVIAR
jgi:hypothetical protein